MSVRFRVDPNQEVAARSLAVCLLASTKAPTARSVSPIISGRPMPNAPMSVAPTPHTTRNATIPRTGCGSLQITSAVSHGHIDPVPGSRQTSGRFDGPSVRAATGRTRQPRRMCRRLVVVRRSQARIGPSVLGVIGRPTCPGDPVRNASHLDTGHRTVAQVADEPSSQSSASQTLDDNLARSEQCHMVHVITGAT